MRISLIIKMLRFSALLQNYELTINVCWQLTDNKARLDNYLFAKLKRHALIYAKGFLDSWMVTVFYQYQLSAQCYYNYFIVMRTILILFVFCLCFAVNAQLNPNLAETCRSNFNFAILHFGECVDICPGRYYVNSSKLKRFVSPDCGLDCPSYLECQLCPPQLFVFPNANHTGCVCAPGYYNNTKFCVPCHYTCGTCNQSGGSCLSCAAGTNRILTPARNCTCPAGYWDARNASNPNCQPCHPDCKECKGPSDTQCLSCGSLRTFDENARCICPRGYFPDQFGNCSCPAPLFTDQSETPLCINVNTSCPINQQFGGYRDGSSTQGGEIIQGPPNQVGVRFIECICRLPSRRIKGVCTSIGPNEVFNPRSGNFECERPAIRVKESCILCKPDQRLDQLTGQCQCDKNFQKDGDGNCVRCPGRSHLERDECVCDYGFYRDPVSKRCSQCVSEDSPQEECLREPVDYDREGVYRFNSI